MAEQLACHNIATIKDEPIDAYNVSESEPAGVERQVIANQNNSTDEMEDVRLPDTVKEEMDIGLTVLQPPDIHFMMQPCKHERADQTQHSYHVAPHVPRQNSSEEQRDIRAEQPSKQATLSKQAQAGIYGSHAHLHGCEHCYEYVDQVNITSDLPQSCDVCKKPYSLKFGLQVASQNNAYSLEIHTHALQYKCGEVLSKRLSQECLSTQRNNIHTGPYSCDVCSKSFVRKSHLARHMDIHADKRRYNCDVCSKHFTRKDHLVAHNTIHTGNRPYNCDVCNKSFMNKSNLVVHKKIHTGRRPYNCDVCNKGFMQKSTLIEHKKTHTGERPYNCDVCSKSFTVKKSLVVHGRIHTGERPYVCDVCNKSFRTRSNLVVHNKIHHSSIRLYNCDVSSESFTVKSS